MNAVPMGRKSRFGTPQLVFVVDDEFSEAVSRTRWSSTHYGYLESVEPGTKTKLWLHRFVWQLKHGWFPACLDHINGLRWDCRISNLRPATRSLNSRNRRVRRQVDLPIGVRLAKNRKARPYQARIQIRGKSTHLGYFESPVEAGNAYRNACEWISGVESSEAAKEAIMKQVNTPMPGDSEYLAAISGMEDTYGNGWRDTSNTPTNLPAVGDFVSGCTAGRRWSGRVESVEGDRLTLDVGGAWITASAADITH